MAEGKKPYRLMRGEHLAINPNYKPGDEDKGEYPHVVAKEGDVCELNDEQYKSFHDKFVPIGPEGTEVADADKKALADAQLKAAATGQNVDPNVAPTGTSTTSSTASTKSK